MPRFIYLHGFNSGYDPENEKIKTLETLGEVSGITYNTYGSYGDILTYLLDKISYADDLILVGTSLGGFWASQVAKKIKCPSIIINPCHDPHTFLQKYEGINSNNSKTGKHGCLNQSAIDTYSGHEITATGEEFFYLPLILLDSGDEILSSSATRYKFEKYPMKVFPGGAHRFSHMKEALPHIENYIRNSEIAEHTF